MAFKYKFVQIGTNVDAEWFKINEAIKTALHILNKDLKELKASIELEAEFNLKQ